MKNLNMIVWLTQLGLSVAAPMAGFTLLAVWLRNTFDLAPWVLYVGIGIGLCSAAEGFRTALKTMERLEKSGRKKEEPTPLSFNDHN